MNYSKKEKYKLYALISLLISILFIPFVSYDFLNFLKIDDVLKIIISILFLVLSIILLYKFLSIPLDCIQAEEIDLKSKDIKILENNISKKYNAISFEQKENYIVSYYEEKIQKKSILFVFKVKEINDDVVNAIEKKLVHIKINIIEKYYITIRNIK